MTFLYFVFNTKNFHFLHLMTAYSRDPLGVSTFASLVGDIKEGVKNKFDLLLLGFAIGCMLGKRK